MVTAEYEISGRSSPFLDRLMCLSQPSSSRCGKSRRNWAPRDSLRSSAPMTMHSATSSMYPSSIAPSTSWLKTVPRSSIAATWASSLRRRMVACASVSPASSRNTAHDVVDHPLLAGQRGARGGRHRHARRALGGVLAGAAAEDQRVEQRVRAQAVAAVHGDAGHLAGGVEARDRGLAVDVGLDATHDVME